MTDYNKAFKVKHGLEATTATVGKVIFGDSSEITTSTGGFGSAIKITPSGGTTSTQALLIYPTAVDGNHLHLTAGGGETEMYLGDDSHYVKLGTTGTVEIRATSPVTFNSVVWNFNSDGTTQIPSVTADATTATSTGTGSLVSISDNAGRLAD